MQQQKHAGQQGTDLHTRWLPGYDKLSYQAQVQICKQAVAYWATQLNVAERRNSKVKTDIAKKRHSDRMGWCTANIRRWRNSLRQCMIAEGVLTQDVVPF